MERGIIEYWPILVRIQAIRSQVQASEMRFCEELKELRYLTKVRISEIRKSLNIETLLHRIERPQLRWFGH